MRKTLSSVTVLAAGILAAGAINLGAQSPTPQTPQTPQQPTTRTPATPTQDRANAELKLTGCLKEEKDVAGLKPNMAERAGITEDYILTNVKASADSKVSGLAVGNMYEIEGINDTELKKHLNHQIEVTGRIDDPKTTGSGTAPRTGAGAGTAANPSDRNRDDVPDFTATSIRMLAATCPAK
jgi:hypothetical protein